MADEWWYTKGTEKHGPISSRELKKLAESGKLQPTDSVWKEGASEWRPASIVKGLFPKDRQHPPPPLPHHPPIPANTIEADSPIFTNVSDKWYQHPATIVISLWVCFPVGLSLIWTRPNWSTKKKGIWTGSYFAIMFLFGLSMSAVVRNSGRPMFRHEFDRKGETGSTVDVSKLTGDMAMIQGRWKFLERPGGSGGGPERRDESIWIFEGDRATFKYTYLGPKPSIFSGHKAGYTSQSIYMFILDESTNPPRITLRDPKGKLTTLRGVYAIRDGELETCYVSDSDVNASFSNAYFDNGFPRQIYRTGSEIRAVAESTNSLSTNESVYIIGMKYFRVNGGQ